jgi:hypothetical protein
LCGVKAAVGPDAQAAHATRLVLEEGDLAVEADLEDLLARNLDEEDLAFLVGGEPLGELVSLADELPGFARVRTFE